VPEWTDFLKQIAGRNTNLQEAGIRLHTLENRVPYSAVLCDGRLVVTPYTSKRNTEESLTVFFHSDGGPIYDLYVDDIMSVAMVEDLYGSESASGRVMAKPA
jgi:hypothetical protein